MIGSNLGANYPTGLSHAAHVSLISGRSLRGPYAVSFVEEPAWTTPETRPSTPGRRWPFAEPRHIQELLGHASVATTQIYTHVSVGHLKETLQRCHPRERGTLTE